jgi:ATP-binding cassette, subfamily B, bacterial
VPELAALVAIAVVLDVAAAIQAEQSRVLAELVARRALDRVIDVSTSVGLLAFESPDFYDRLMRARAQGHFRSMQTATS